MSLLRSLAAQDERIIAEFKAISEGKRPSRSIVEWPEDSVVVGHDINLKDFPESIELRIYPKLVKLEWLPFEEARAFVHTLELKGAAEWNDYSAGRMEKEEGTRPPNIPANPDTVYKDTGWISMPDWLGYKRKK